MPLLNYTTNIAAEKTAGEIMGILGSHKARAIGMEYDGNGNVVGLAWQSDTPHGVIAFKLPVNVDAVYHILTKQGVLRSSNSARYEQARRTAWRILKTWIEGQMALLETQMVTLDQLFLPYARTRDGRTLYEQMLEDGFVQLALPPGRTVDGH